MTRPTHELTSPRPDRRRRYVALAAGACSMGLALTSGCGLFRSGDDDYAGDVDAPAITTRPATTQQTWNSSQPLPQALQPTNRPVVQGQLPLIYLVESDVNIRVTNVTSGEEIATFPAKAPQIVRVEPKGVLLANKPVIGAALAPGTYAIEIVHGNVGTVQARQTVTRAVPAAATRPASRPAAPKSAPKTPAPLFPEPAAPATPPPATPPTQ